MGTETTIPAACTGRPMNEAPNVEWKPGGNGFAYILARGRPIRNGAKWPDYEKGDEVITKVRFCPGFFVEPHGPTVGDRWLLADHTLGIHLEAEEWWPIPEDAGA